MSSGMNLEQAKELASKRNYKWAVGNLKYGFKGVAYKKATTILLHELAEIADRLVFCKDCKHRNTAKCAINNDNDFCSYGERIDNE